MNNKNHVYRKYAILFFLILNIAVFIFSVDYSVRGGLREISKHDEVFPVNSNVLFTRFKVGHSPICKNIPCWLMDSYDDEKWDLIDLPQLLSKTLKNIKVKPNDKIYTRMHLKLPAELVRSDYSIAFYIGYIFFEKYTIYIENQAVFEGQGESVSTAITVLTIPKKYIRANRLLTVTIEGKFGPNDSGIANDEGMLIGNYDKIIQAYYINERRFTTWGLLWLLPLMTLLLFFGALSYYLNNKKIFYKSFYYTIISILIVILSTDFPGNIISFRYIVLIYCACKIIQSRLVLECWAEVIMEEVVSKKQDFIYVGAAFISVMLVILFSYRFTLITLTFIMRFVKIFYTAHIFYLCLITFKKFNKVKNVKIYKELPFIVIVFYLFLSICTVIWNHSEYAISSDLVFSIVMGTLSIIEFVKNEEILKNQSLIIKEQERDSAIGKTTALLAHDIRSSFSLINILLENLTSKEHHFFNLYAFKTEIKKKINSVNTLIEEILDFSRLNRMYPKNCSIYQLVDLAFDQIYYKNRTSEIIFEYEFKSKYMIYADQKSLTRCFANIIRNGIEAINEIGQHQSGYIKITTDESYINNKCYVKICFENSGPHIPENRVNDLFKVFETVGKKRGTGLGLASVKKIVDSNNGYIYAENCKSEDKKGVKFIIFLPSSLKNEFKRKDFLIQDISKLDIDKKAYLLNSLSKMIINSKRVFKILILEDEEIYIDWIKYQFLNSEDLKNNFKIQYVNCCADALKLVDITHDFDFFIVDINLKGEKTGIDFINSCQEKLLDCRFMIHSSEVVDRFGFNKEKVFFCPKPLKIEDILIFVKEKFLS